MRDLSVRISGNKLVATNVFQLTISAPTMANSAQPGQFIHLKPAEDSSMLLRRPFSINDIDKGKISVLYRVVGRGTEYISALKTGQYLKIIGPLGKGFLIKRNTRKHLVVAGGMGLAPMHFLTRRLAQFKLDHLVYYGCSGRPELLPCPGRKKIMTTDDGSCGRKGFVTEVLNEGLEKYDHPSVYACGPWPMLKKVAALCLERKVECQVSLEAFMACGVGACQGCAVKGAKDYLTVCHDGPVFDAREIDWEQDIDL